MKQLSISPAVVLVFCFAFHLAHGSKNNTPTACADEAFLPPPANDNSANAITLAHNLGCSANAAYTTASATPDGAKPSKWQTGPHYNVWFKFQATTTSMSADLKTGTPEGTMRRPRLSLHTSTLTELVSQGDYGTYVDIGLSYEGLTVGSWYYLNVDNGEFNYEPGTFALCLRTTVTSDYPAGAITVAHNSGCSALAAYTTMIGTPNGTRPAGWQIGPNNNVWFKFQATATTVGIMVKTADAEGSMRRISLALHDASMTVLRSAAHNIDWMDVGLSYDALTIGSWYYINVDNGDLVHERGTFTLCVENQTSYDYPGNATVITHMANWCSADAAYTTMVGTPNGTKPANWTAGPVSNVWFKFQATTTEVSIALKTEGAQGNMRRPKLALYNNSLTELSSVNEIGNYADIGLSYTPLTIGQWYYIAIDNGDIFYERGTFTLCVSTAVTNDYPIGAVEITDMDGWCSDHGFYSTLNATPDGAKPANWYNGPNANVWFKFTAVSTDVSVNLNFGDTEGTLKRGRLALLTNTFTVLASNVDNGNNYVDVGVSYSGLTIGSLYYIMVDNGGTTGMYDRGTFQLCVNSFSGPDYPAGAVYLTDVNNWCSPQQAYTTFSGTPDGPRPTSWTYGPSNNIWFKFKAARPNVTINVKTGSAEGGLKWPNVSLHNKTLTHLVSVKDIGQYNDITINNYNGLTVGQWYYIQVDNGTSTYDRNTFTLCIDNGLAGTTAFTATGGSGQNELDWTYTNGNQSGFEIQRSYMAGGGFRTIAVVGSAIREFSDTTALSTGTYYYRVRAYNSGGASVFSAEIPVTTYEETEQIALYTNVVGATLANGVITKTAAAGWGNAGAESKNRLPDHADGWVRYTVQSLTAGEFAFGLTDANPDNQFYSIGYGFHLSNTAQTYVRLLGTMFYSFNAVLGDVLEIERLGTDINFKQNGAVLYTASNVPVNSMLVDISLNTAGAKIAGLSTSFNGPGSFAMDWTALVGVTKTDSITLTKTAPAGYGNAGAISGGILESGKDGWVEFKLDALNQEKTVGLSDVNSDNNVSSIDYAFNVSGNTVSAYENGVSRGAVAGAAVNDKLRVWRIGDDVYWLKNGAVVSTKVNGATTAAMQADVAINTAGAKVLNARTSFDLQEGNVPDQVEFLALKKIWETLGGQNWYNKGNWPTQGNWPADATSSEFQNWFGVYVKNGDVYQIVLTDNNLIGTLPAELTDLVELEHLYLWNNQISGSIPVAFGNLVKLQSLYLNQNQVSGAFPTGMNNLTALIRVGLRANSFSGPLPFWIYNLPVIEELDLSDNAFSGSISPDIGNLTTLKYLAIGNTLLTGNIPPSIGNLVNLTHLDLNRNDLTGPLPTTIGNLTACINFWVWQNQLSGPIPPEIGNMASLDYLELSDNQFTGQLPGNLWGLSNLRIFAARYNQLTGRIPNTLGSLTKLTGLHLDNNQLIGGIPESITELTNLTQLTLGHNPLWGFIPENIGNMTSLYLLHIDWTDINGQIPESIGNLDNLSSLNLTGNSLTGPIPATIGNCSALEILSLEHNKLTGEIPASLGNVTTLRWLQISGNDLVGGIPQSVANIASLTSITAAMNNFTTLPTTWATRSQKSLYFNENNLTAPVVEALFSAVNQHGFAYFAYGSVQGIPAPDQVLVNLNSPLVIPSVNVSPQGTIKWSFRPIGGGSWTDATSLNQDPSQLTFKINSFQASNMGYYYYVQYSSLAGYITKSEEMLVSDGQPLPYYALRSGNWNDALWSVDGQATVGDVLPPGAMAIVEGVNVTITTDVRVKNLTAGMYAGNPGIVTINSGTLISEGPVIVRNESSLNQITVLGTGRIKVRKPAAKIMPLGNATSGTSTTYSYRYPLWTKLVDANFAVDFVGSRNMNGGGAGNPVFPPYKSETFDPDHEGHGSARADEILVGLYASVNANQPDIILLHAGTEDMIEGQSVSSTKEELRTMIQVARSAKPNVKILLATLIPHATVSMSAMASAITALVNEEHTTQSPVILVDQYSGFNAATDTYDGMNPNAAGEDKMAQKWYNAIVANWQ